MNPSIHSPLPPRAGLARYAIEEHPFLQKIKQSQLERLIGGEGAIGDAEARAGPLGRGVVRPQPAEVFLARQNRVNIKIATRFDILEKGRFVESKIDFRRIEQLKKNHLMALG